VFGLVGGALFGPVWGTLLNLAGATLGATAAFLVARYVAADWVRARTGARLDRIISGVEAEGWRFVALMRLVPLVPFNLLKYALGLTRISLPHYFLASLIAMAPGTLAFTWLGHAGRRALDGDTSAIRYGLLALGLLAAIAFVPRLVGRLRRSSGPRWIEVADLRRLQQEGLPITILDVRSASDFGGPLGHIAGARNVPLGEIGKRLGELQEFAKFPIVLVCRAQTMSAKAAAILEAGDFQDVRVLKGGTLAWNAMQSAANGAEAPPATEDCPGRSS
jgi:rhodanese-related sulfurtransferase/membrane protein DedA with SNARE-associated domain